ncbi:MAG: beta-galactosidase trimerization domain-containing protein, partial [Anaerolineae bacterium]|nr:beta-galactosidase trimerization domain-containing protein [Anaerolineae bacterium]
GILPHDGRPGRTYEEVRDLGQELIRLAPALEGTSPRAGVAFVLDYESMWALEQQPHHAALSDPWRYFEGAYRYLLGQHLPVDFVTRVGDLSGYRLVIAPALFVLDPEAVENLARFVQGGGTLLVTVRSGQKDEHNRVVDVPFPGLLAPLLGVTVREFDSRPAGQVTAVTVAAAWGGCTV